MAKKGAGNYFVGTLNGMAYGFFSSLIIGTILCQIGTYAGISELVTWGSVAKILMGPAIGVGIAYTIGATGLNLIVAVIAGAIGAGTYVNGVAAVGNPISAYIAVILAVEATKFVQGKTPVDILLVPFTSIVVAGLVTTFIGPYISAFITWIGELINQGVTMQPFFMSIVVAVLMGMALTAPISSAAIGVMLNLSGLAAGAALAGCCAQMIGFAIMSMDDNDIGDVIAIGIGTSMLQFKNIVRNPIIWLPTIITSAIIAPISTIVFKIQCNAVGAGMGTAGFVGPLAAVDVMGPSSWVVVMCVDILLPLFITYGIYKGLRKLNYIKAGDLKINKL